MKKLALGIAIGIILILSCPKGEAQQPQSSSAPDYGANARYLQGYGGGGYAPKCTSANGACPGSDLVLHIGKGTATCNSAGVTSIVTYAGGTLALTNNATNYVWVAPCSSGTPGFSTSAPSHVPLYTVVTSGGAIQSYTEARTPFAETLLATIGNALSTTSYTTSMFWEDDFCSGVESAKLGWVKNGGGGAINMLDNVDISNAHPCAVNVSGPSTSSWEYYILGKGNSGSDYINPHIKRRRHLVSRTEEILLSHQQTWDGIRLGLMALGYQRVIWTHLSCLQHGVFRVAIAEEMEEYPCPTCQQACKVAIIAHGFTKYALPPPERLSKPLSARTRHELLVPERLPKRPRRATDVHHGGKLRRGLPEHQPACDSRPRARVVRNWAMP